MEANSILTLSFDYNLTTVKNIGDKLLRTTAKAGEGYW